MHNSDWLILTGVTMHHPDWSILTGVTLHHSDWSPGLAICDVDLTITGASTNKQR